MDNRYMIINNELLDIEDDINNFIVGAVDQIAVQANRNDEVAGILLGVEEDDDGNDDLAINERDEFVRSNHYYNHVIPRFCDRQFFDNFRMSKEMYMDLEEIIMPHVENPNDETIPGRKKLLSTIWLLATPESFRSVADRFGLAKAMCHVGFTEIVTILKNLLPIYINWPTDSECAESEAVFYQRSRFPGVVGAIDGCHIQIKQPPGNDHDYYNRHSVHSIILQGTCNHNGQFIDVLIGRPGRLHDATVFRTSPLYARLTDEDQPLLSPHRHLIADSAYSLIQNVMTPFRDNGHLTGAQRNYNTRLSSIRSIIERAFARLKGKFRRLKYLDVNSVPMGNLVIAASCMLHNFLIINENLLVDANINDDDNDDINANEDSDNDSIEDPDEYEEHLNAREKRNYIMNRL